MRTACAMACAVLAGGCAAEPQPTLLLEAWIDVDSDALEGFLVRSYHPTADAAGPDCERWESLLLDPVEPLLGELAFEGVARTEAGDCEGDFDDRLLRLELSRLETGDRSEALADVGYVLRVDSSWAPDRGTGELEELFAGRPEGWSGADAGPPVG